MARMRRKPTLRGHEATADGQLVGKPKGQRRSVCLKACREPTLAGRIVGRLCRRSRGRHIKELNQVLLHRGERVVPERAVAFELRFIEPLIVCRLVRKLGKFAGVSQDVRRLSAAQPRFDIKDLAWWGPRLGVARRADHEYGTLPPGRGRVGLAEPIKLRELKLNAQIDAYLAHRISEVGKIIITVRARVADHDYGAPAPYHFVQAEVLKVTAVGEVNIRPIVCGQAEQFREEGAKRQIRTILAIGSEASLARISEPPAEAHIQHSKQQADQWR